MKKFVSTVMSIAVMTSCLPFPTAYAEGKSESIVGENTALSDDNKDVVLGYFL